MHARAQHSAGVGHIRFCCDREFILQSTHAGPPTNASPSRTRRRRKANIGTTGWIMQPTGSAGGSDRKDCAYRKVHRKPKKNPRRPPSYNRQRRCARSALKPRARPLHVRKPRIRRQRPMQILRQRLHPHRGLNCPGCRTCLPPCSLHRIRSKARKPLAQATRYRWRTILRRRRQVNHLSPLPPQEPSPPPAPTKSGEIDHTFALLIIVFAVLGIAGPIIHFVDRRRRRRIVITKEEPRVGRPW